MAVDKKKKNEEQGTLEVGQINPQPSYEELLAQLEAEKAKALALELEKKELEDELTPLPMSEMVAPPAGIVRIYLAKTTRQEARRLENKAAPQPGFRAKISMVVCLPQVGAIIPAYRYQVMASQDDKTHLLNVFSMRANRDSRPFRGEVVRSVRGYQIQFRNQDRMSQATDIEVFSWEEAILKGLADAKNKRGTWPKWFDVKLPEATGKHIPILGSDSGEDEDEGGSGGGFNRAQAAPASAEHIRGTFDSAKKGSKA